MVIAVTIFTVITAGLAIGFSHVVVCVVVVSVVEVCIVEVCVVPIILVIVATAYWTGAAPLHSPNFMFITN